MRVNFSGRGYVVGFGPQYLLKYCPLYGQHLFFTTNSILNLNIGILHYSKWCLFNLEKPFRNIYGFLKQLFIIKYLIQFCTRKIEGAYLPELLIEVWVQFFHYHIAVTIFGNFTEKHLLAQEFINNQFQFLRLKGFGYKIWSPLFHRFYSKVNVWISSYKNNRKVWFLHFYFFKEI